MKPNLIPRIITLLILSLFLMLLDSFKLLSFPKKITQTITLPIESGIYNLYQTTVNNFGFLTFWHNGYQEINYLRQRNAQLMVDANLVHKLKQENEILKKQFSTREIPASELLAANIIGYNRYLYIDKGAKDGVKKSQTVVLQNLLVGVVEKVEERTATIQLPTDPQSKITAVTAKNRAKGLLLGQFGAEMLLDEVIQAENVAIEEPVEVFNSDITSNGLIVGNISRSLGNQNTIFQKFSVKPILDFAKLTTVFIKIN